ncbi:LysR family transcriptional regulator [Paraburkholderia sp. MM5384-R2]|uniref:LysR family transcriptional regulator n=1 Tax=Paraburkholderia sp. MM5384-R2 TaxID=2723097 RepID=UPI001619F608|nr:LysR family transcriptional regulator [Paraburkholderia sp. MM5384-R2]MBB5498666.1 LysR family transcriptional regulator for bpeEF and oprC [Paraburkholderia sp. MM5384-R2]
MDELRPLWIFLQVARHGSLSSAAQALTLSPAALSKSVSRLEARLEVQLFTRTTRSLQLTDEGRRLFEQLDNSFSDIQTALHGLRLKQGDVSGSVRLSTVTGFGRARVLPILGEFFERYPRVDLVMSLHDGARGLSRHAYDVRINWGEELEQTKVGHRLCKMDLVLVGCPSYLARRGSPRRPRDLEEHDCISVGLANNQRARWQFSKRNGSAKQETVVPHGRLIVVDELVSVVDAALSGLGLTVVARDLVAAHLASGALVQLLASYAIEGVDVDQTVLILQHPKRRLMSPATQALVDFLIEKLKQSS